MPFREVTMVEIKEIDLRVGASRVALLARARFTMPERCGPMFA